jgi:hypothetical protein
MTIVDRSAAHISVLVVSVNYALLFYVDCDCHDIYNVTVTIN